VAFVSAYYRPATIDEALALLERPDAVLLGGGTKVNVATGLASAGPVEMVDLQALGLDGVERIGDDRLLIGSMTTLRELVDDDDVPLVVRETAERQAPSTLQSASTVGGCIATAEGESEFLAALLAHHAKVKVIEADGVHTLGLAEVIADRGLLRGGIITAITLQDLG
jgi:CO/xanthine dehydrogenase FAD-binding subunit